MRMPYIGAGVDGARRSATIDREEAATLEPGPRRDDLLASAEEWDRQAAAPELALERALEFYHRTYHEHYPTGGDAADHDEAHREAIAAVLEASRG